MIVKNVITNKHDQVSRRADGRWALNGTKPSGVRSVPVAIRLRLTLLLCLIITPVPNCEA